MLVRPLTRPLVRPLTRRVTQPGFGWSPLALFAASEQGAWYDPSDLSSMNTKHDGSGAVPAVGDPVGYIADKSGRGNHAKQTTDTARPTLQLAAGRYYLQFDGVDDFLVTNAIDFTGTDKMTVVAGVRKESDAGWQLIAGLSANPATVAGTFGVGCGTLNGDASRRTFGSYLFGSVSQLAGAGVFAAPYTGVLTCAYDLAQGTREAELVLRVNSAGTSPSYSAANAGDGSFGSHALYIGRTGGTANAFNGRIYSLLVRGAASTQAQIETAERYANSKTGAF